MIIMAKFCGNCGAQMDDDAKVCGQCGTPIEENAAKAPEVKAVDPEKKKEMAKKVKGVITLVIVAAVAIVAVKMISGFSGTKGLVRKIMTAYEKYDIDTIVSLSSDMYYYSDAEDYVDEYFEYAVGKNLDSFEDSVGHNYKMSYEVEEIYDLSQRKQDETLKAIEDRYPDFDLDIIKKIAVADVKVTAKQGSKSASKTVNIIMSKEGKTWRLLYLE